MRPDNCLNSSSRLLPSTGSGHGSTGGRSNPDCERIGGSFSVPSEPSAFASLSIAPSKSICRARAILDILSHPMADRGVRATLDFCTLNPLLGRLGTPLGRHLGRLK